MQMVKNPVHRQKVGNWQLTVSKNRELPIVNCQLFRVYGYRFFLTVLLLFSTVFTLLAGETDTIFAGILTYKRLEKIEFSVSEGNYEVWTNGQKDFEMSSGEKVTIGAQKDMVSIFSDDTLRSKNFLIRFNGTREVNIFGIKVLGTRDKSVYKYEGGLLITANGKSLKLINIVGVEDYLKGVMKAECGDLDAPAFLRAMAVVARTYTLRNMYRHVTEGYDLCDKVHCQVYKGLNDVSDKILQAIEDTKDKVIIDRNKNLINAVFHSNSGGHTVGSEMVWSQKESYLKPKEDPFSAHGIHYTWTHSVPLDEWKTYLANKTSEPVSQPSFKTELSRWEDYLFCNNIRIPLKDIRRDFNLKSSYFICRQNGDTVTFEGRGYGHGVGLSQEGANYMAKTGYNYLQIIKYYYSGVEIINYQGWKALLVSGKP